MYSYNRNEMFIRTEVGIYTRKQENKNPTKKEIKKKERKQELGQESDQENKKKGKKNKITVGLLIGQSVWSVCLS